MASWWQGDYYDSGDLFYLANPHQPLTRVAQDAVGEVAEAVDAIVIEGSPVGLVALTQTCDIRRSSKNEPFVHFARVVELDEETARQARGKRRPRYVNIPGRSERSFADLQGVITVEKAVVAKWERRVGCQTDQERKDFTEGVRRRWSRFAFPDDVNATLEPLRGSLDKDDGKNNKNGNVIRELRQIRASADAGWEVSPIDLYLYFVLAPTEESAVPDEDCAEVIDAWMNNCPKKGQVRTLEWEITRFDQLNAHDFWLSEELDTDAFSAS
jgi:hypothetical protein